MDVPRDQEHDPSHCVKPIGHNTEFEPSSAD